MTKIQYIHVYTHFAGENEPTRYFVSVTRKQTHHYGPVTLLTVNRILLACIYWNHTVLCDMSKNKTGIALTIILSRS